MMRAFRELLTMSHFTYRQYDSVALIYEDGKAFCTAKLSDGVWTANFQRQENETRFQRDLQDPLYTVSGESLDYLTRELALRPRGDWIRSDTAWTPYDAVAWAAATGNAT